MIEKLILGTVQFGLEYGINNTLGKPSRNDVFNILDLAFESGIKSLDTADQYGSSSALIGEYHQSRQHKFLVNTKFKVGQGVTVKTQVTDSLASLKVESIDVYFYHSFKDLVQYPELKKELVNLKEDQKICKIGVSIYTNEESEQAADIPEIDVIQIPFNVLDNSAQRMNSIQKAKAKGKIIQARSVFLQGLFFKSPESFPEKLFPLRKYAEQILALSKGNELSIENICMAYVLNQAAIDQVIIGVDSVEQLKRNVSYAQSPLSGSLINEIDSIDVKEKELLYPINWK